MSSLMSHCKKTRGNRCSDRCAGYAAPLIFLLSVDHAMYVQSIVEYVPPMGGGDRGAMLPPPPHFYGTLFARKDRDTLLMYVQLSIRRIIGGEQLLLAGSDFFFCFFVFLLRENHHYYNETQTLRNPRSHATTRQGWLKTPGWAWQGSTKHKISIHACTFNYN